MLKGANPIIRLYKVQLAPAIERPQSLFTPAIRLGTLSIRGRIGWHPVRQRKRNSPACGKATTGASSGTSPGFPPFNATSTSQRVNGATFMSRISSKL